MRPMLAEDFEEGKLRFPLFAQPKIDGVRGLNMTGSLTGRSLKAHKNVYTTKFYSRSFLAGNDGELAAEHECHPDLCRITASAVGTILGEPYTLWWLFDRVTPETIGHPYYRRYEQLIDHIREVATIDVDVWNRLRVMPNYAIQSKDELDQLEERLLLEGYEGVCIRDPEGRHKQGRSTVREMGLLRIKRFVESEALITGIVEGQENLNPAQINELGKTFRSSHQENKIGNAMVGHFKATAMQEVKDPHTQAVLIKEGQELTISPGNMNHLQRKYYFENPGMILGKVCKYKFFPKGIKDKPRFPTFRSLKIESDM